MTYAGSAATAMGSTMNGMLSTNPATKCQFTDIEWLGDLVTSGQTREKSLGYHRKERSDVAIFKIKSKKWELGNERNRTEPNYCTQRCFWARFTRKPFICSQKQQEEVV